MSTIQQTFDGVESDQHDGEAQCPECGQWCKRLGTHWNYNEDHRPSLTNHQREIIKGSLLGDGSYAPSKSCFEWNNNTTLPYLKWVKDQFGSLVSDILFSQTPKEARIAIQQSFGKSCDCMGGFTLRTRSHPELTFCEDWGRGENTYFSDNLTLTPMMVKIWYASDGSLNYKEGDFSHISITNWNQIDRVEYLTSLFKDIGFDVGISSNKISISVSQTERFFEYIGEPFTDSDAGFKYKWQHHDYEEYNRLKNIHDSQPYLSNWSKDD